MIRKAVVADYPECLGVASSLFHLYPQLIPNKDSIKRIFDECVSGARNCAWVSEIDGRIVGCLMAISYDHLWAQKQSSSVLIWACQESGDGIRLLKKYRDWVDSRAVIRRGGFQFDFECDARVYRALEACGFARRGGCFLREKGV